MTLSSFSGSGKKSNLSICGCENLFSLMTILVLFVLSHSGSDRLKFTARILTLYTYSNNTYSVSISNFCVSSTPMILPSTQKPSSSLTTLKVWLG